MTHHFRSCYFERKEIIFVLVRVFVTKIILDVHIHNVALKATRLLDMILKIFSTCNVEFMVKILKVYVRSILEYASVVWSPSSVALVDLLDNMQRRFTKRLRRMFRVFYDDHLRILNL